MGNESCESDVSVAEASVLRKSTSMPLDSTVIKGYDFNDGIDYDNLLNFYISTGFQASHFAQAVQVISYCSVNDKEGGKMLKFSNNRSKIFRTHRASMNVFKYLISSDFHSFETFLRMNWFFSK